MNPWTPDAMHHIAADRRRDAVTAADIRRRTRPRRHGWSWTTHLSARFRALRRPRAIELPHPAPLQTDPPA